MKLYLAIETWNDFDSGSSNTLLGVFSTKELALKRLTESTWYDDFAEEKLNGWLRNRGQDSIRLIVRQVELDVPVEI